VKIAKACKKSRYQLFVSNDLKLALKVKANGIYIPSFNKTKKFLNLEKKNFLIIGSAHNQKEIQKKIAQNCSAVFLSPLFNIEKSKKFLGLYKFNYLSHMNKINTLALGGISENKSVNLSCYILKVLEALAYSKKNRPLKRPVFISSNLIYKIKL